MESFFNGSFSWIVGFIADIGYLGVMFLMMIESSFIPFPSEVIIPPAAFLAQQGQMNIILVVLAGLAGCLLGALLNYYLALTLGRKIIYALANKKFTSFLLINSKKVEKTEEYFLKYGNLSTFVGRLVPAVRQLISIPAGFSRMNLSSFIFYTSLGSGIWVIILAVLGYSFGSNQEKLEQYYGEISLVFVILAVLLVVGLVFKSKIKSKNKKVDI
ncbi:MAG: DedA family protein [Candidatus Marinimicrobia bacterium]|nr:DedA family protein [Candidatus Neomarinimicrobiota bacterium]